MTMIGGTQISWVRITYLNIGSWGSNVSLEAKWAEGNAMVEGAGVGENK